MILLIIILANSFFAQTKSNAAARIIEDKTNGYTFALPKDWTISSTGNSAFLILNSQKGSGQKKFAITPRQASNEVGLNGAKYFVQAHAECN